jgi:integrase
MNTVTDMSETKRKPRAKSRGNGQGCAYQRPGQKTWTVEVVVGWKYPGGDITKPRRPVRKTRGGFPTKKAALDYVKTLQTKTDEPVRMTMQEVWLAWKPAYEKRIDPSTMTCYYSAYKHYSSLHGTYMDKITPEELQGCMDTCGAGKRTRQNMRTIAGLLWKYAIGKNVVTKNIASNLYTGKGQSVQREPLTPAEENTVLQSIGRERYAEYIYCLCYLGFRPGEFLELKKSHLFCANLSESPDSTPSPVWYFVNGKKTEAGRNRIVVIPDAILPYVLERVYIPGTDLLFPQYVFNRKGDKLLRFKQMSDDYFREDVFKPMMSRLGIAEGKVPYGTRHSYADKLKAATGSDKDKAQLIGHSNYLFTQSAYQTSDLADLHALVNSFR